MTTELSIEEQRRRWREATRRHRTKNDTKIKIRNYSKKYHAENKDKEKAWRQTFKRKSSVRKQYQTNERFKLMQLVRQETKYNFLKEATCEICKSGKNLQFHHWRYRQPVQKTDFSTLCVKCHKIQHAEFIGVSK